MTTATAENHSITVKEEKDTSPNGHVTDRVIVCSCKWKLTANEQFVPALVERHQQVTK